MEQSSPRESGGCLSGEEIPRFLQNLKVYCCVHNIPPLVPILNRIFDTHPVCLCWPHQVLLVTHLHCLHHLGLSENFMCIRGLRLF